jgi:ornithine cyclodeaminase/alanine dehydrogenase-like protein (mu-crystallin family)
MSQSTASPSAHPILFLSAADSACLLTAPGALADIVPCMAEAMKATALGDTTRRNRTTVSHRPVGGGLEHALMTGPAVAAGLGAGVRAYTGIRRGPSPKAEPWGVRLLFDYETMTLQMLAMEASLHPVRTACGGAAVVQALARPGARMALIGSGRIARVSARALIATCTPAQLTIYSPNPEHREALARELRAEHSLPVDTAPSIGDAVRHADVVTSVTEAEPPALDFSAVKPGALVVSLGLNELTAETVKGGRVLATGLPEILEDERRVEPFRTLYSTTPPLQEALDFCDVLLHGGNDSWDPTITTWVMALGTAVWDLALMRWLYEHAVTSQIGTWLDP